MQIISISYRSGWSPNIRNDVHGRAGLAQNRTGPRSGAAKPTPPRKHQPIGRRLPPRAENLRYWSARRATARVVLVPTDRSEVRFGTSVTIVRGRWQRTNVPDLSVRTKPIPSQGSISHVSPLARSMFEKNVWGDVVHAGAGESRDYPEYSDQSTRTLQFGPRDASRSLPPINMNR